MLCDPGEVSVEQSCTIFIQCLLHGLPCEAVVARHALTSQVLDLSRPNVVGVELHMRYFAIRGRPKVEHRESAHYQGTNQDEQGISECGLHWACPPATSNSLPVTTPEATVIRARPSIGISTFATPRLIGTSTVVLPAESDFVKLTTVPSGTALPEQSRTGSVSIRNAFFVRLALIRRLQGSAATCCTTRTSLAFPIEAAIRTGPSFLAELIRTQATPFCEPRSAEISFASFGRMLNLTCSGLRTKLWKLSNTNATVLIPFALPTGTREGWTNRLNLFGAAGTTKKFDDAQPSEAHSTAT